MNKNRKKFLSLIAAMLLCCGFGLFFELENFDFEFPFFSSKSFEKTFQKKEQKAAEILAQMQFCADENQNFSELKFPDDDIAFYAFSGDELTFFSDYNYDVSALKPSALPADTFLSLPNAFCVAKRVSAAENRDFLALIKIKENFPKETDFVQNDFAKGFTALRKTAVKSGTSADKLAIFSQSGTYLFSLEKKLNYSPTFYLSVLFWGLAFLLFFYIFLKIDWWFGKRIYLLRYFLFAFLFFGLVTFLCLIFGFPKPIFSLEISSAIYYKSTGYLSSIGHLILLTLLLFSAVYFFYFRVYFKIPQITKFRIPIGLFLVQIFSLFFFCGFYQLFANLISFANFPVIFLKIQDVSALSIISFLLIGMWLTAFILIRTKLLDLMLNFAGFTRVVVSDFVVFASGFFLLFLQKNDFSAVFVCYFAICQILNFLRSFDKKYFSYPSMVVLILTMSFFIGYESLRLEMAKILPVDLSLVAIARFWIYLTFFYLVIVFLGYFYWRRINKISVQATVFNRLLGRISFFLMFGLTLIMTLVFVFLFVRTQKEYSRERKMILENVKLQISFAFENAQTLDLQTIKQSKIVENLKENFSSDIKFFDKNGHLILSSEPQFFPKEFVRNLMNPKAISALKFSNDFETVEHLSKYRFYAMYTPLRNGSGEVLGYVCVPYFETLLNMQSEIFTLLSMLLLFYFLLGFFTIFLCYFLAKKIGDPIKDVEKKLKNIKFGKKNEKVEYDFSYSDEIAQLVMQYNIMVDELAYSAEMLAKSEREQAFKQMARQIAHEINNPLTPMRLTVQQLQRMKKSGSEKFDAYFDKTSAVLIEQIENLSRIASEFSAFARMPNAEPTRVDLVARLRPMVELLDNNYRKISLSFSANADSAVVLADNDYITQIFNNLLQNALQALDAERAGVIKVVLTSENQSVTVAVRDNGVGIPQENRQRIFLPDFTTKTSGKGLGLAIVKNLVTLLNGEISFEQNEDFGTTFLVRFPAISGEKSGE